jgi:hypothetical protein
MVLLGFLVQLTDDTPDAMEGEMSLKDGTKLELREKSTIGFFRNLFGL